jgi:hypothetical protein
VFPTAITTFHVARPIAALFDTVPSDPADLS